MISKLNKKAYLLPYYLVENSIIKGNVSIFAGLKAGCIAFVEFSMDSLIGSIR